METPPVEEMPKEEPVEFLTQVNYDYGTKGGRVVIAADAPEPSETHIKILEAVGIINPKILNFAWGSASHPSVELGTAQMKANTIAEKLSDRNIAKNIIDKAQVYRTNKEWINQAETDTRLMIERLKKQIANKSFEKSAVPGISLVTKGDEKGGVIELNLDALSNNPEFGKLFSALGALGLQLEMLGRPYGDASGTNTDYITALREMEDILKFLSNEEVLRAIMTQYSVFEQKAAENEAIEQWLKHTLM